MRAPSSAAPEQSRHPTNPLLAYDENSCGKTAECRCKQFCPVHGARRYEEKEKRSLKRVTNWRFGRLRIQSALRTHGRHRWPGPHRGRFASGPLGGACALGPFFEFRTGPAVDIDRAVPIFQKSTRGQIR